MGVELDQLKADAIRAGRAPVAEPGLDEILAEAIAEGRLEVTDLKRAVAEAEVVMVAVGTPSASDGTLDLTAVERVCRQIARALPDDGRFRTVVIRSTVLPGTTRGTIRPILEEAAGRQAGVDFGLATNPEFLREGSGVADFFAASRTVIGADDERSAAAASAVYAALDAPLNVVAVATSELVKYTDNAFHALKITFANEIASFARAHAVDGREVMRLMTSDERLNISPAYLRPGFAFGGSCLPKDVRALVARAASAEVELPLLSAMLPSNAAHFERGLALVESVAQPPICLLGLSFKSGTDDLRESPAVALAEALIARGHVLSIYDEDVTPDSVRGTNRAYIEAHLPHIAQLLRPSLEEALAGAGTIVVTKLWPAIDGLPGRLRPEQVVVDLLGVPWATDSVAARYVGIGW